MAKDLLLEIGTEEIPAEFIERALEGLKQSACHILPAKQIEFAYDNIKTWATPRRLALYIAEVAEKQVDIQEKFLGPPLRIAKDKQGNYTKAAIGFAGFHKVNPQDLIIVDDPKGKRLAYIRQRQGLPVIDVLPEILQQLICGMSFPKSMRWGAGNFEFARPVHWILALFGAEVVDFSINNIKSGNYTYGHRFLNPLAPPSPQRGEGDINTLSPRGRGQGEGDKGNSHASKLTIPSPQDYLSILKENYVIVDPIERKELIKRQLADINEKLDSGAQVALDEQLLNEVTNLVEYPVAVVGNFEEKFLKLPDEVLTTSLKHHQKCFSVTNKNGSLLPLFVTISNIPDKKGYIRAGNERVVRARLSDASFFYEEDLKKTLTERVEDLKGVIFQKKLGTYYDKAKRIEALAGFIAQGLGGSDIEKVYAETVGLLCKSDLVTEMVGEFPELQGIIGGSYAFEEYKDKAKTEDEVLIANAISQHYNFDPVDLPVELVDIAVNIADKIDSVAGYIGVGMLPTGSEDPYAIKRQLMAVIHMLLKSKVSFSIRDLINKALKLYENKITRNIDEITCNINRLFYQRLETIFKKYRYDLVDAVLSAGFDDIRDTELRLKALSNLSKRADFDPLMIAFRRVARIIPEDYQPEEVNEILLEDRGEQAEKELYNHFKQIKDKLDFLMNKNDYDSVLTELAGLKPYVDKFFDDVLVMDKRTNLRLNRFNLLAEIKAAFSPIADFSKIVAQ